MSIVTASKLTKSFGPDTIFTDVTIDVPHGARVALVGPNGAGKTTLIRLLIGLDDPSAGTVNRARSVTVGYLPQDVVFESTYTLWDEMLTAFSGLQQQEIFLSDLAQQMADPELSSADRERVTEQYGAQLETFEQAGGYTFEADIKRTLTGLGFLPDDYHKLLTMLSGGQRTRAYLAKLLLERPTLLALDEPTNHLDIQAVEWLESFLVAWPGAVIVISHDRYFIDRVANVIWELDWGEIETYRGNYTAYVKQREERQAARFTAFEAQQEKIAKEEEYIRRNIAGQNTRQAKGRLKRLDRLKRDDLIASPQHARQLRFKLATGLRSGDKVLSTRALQIGYPDGKRPLFEVADLLLLRGEIAALIGPNGAGKTTFLKTTLQMIPPQQGLIQIGASVKIGYFAQGHESLDSSRSILDELLSVQEMPISQARQYLGTFLFSGDDVFRPISTLSGGERGRVALAKLSLGGSNFLMLDEPTNHLDIPAQEVLQAVLAEFSGTVLLVSHDRYLVDALATQIWAVEAGMDGINRLRVFKGTYQEYVAARETERQSEADRRTAQAMIPTPIPAARPPVKNARTGKLLSKWELEKRTATLEQEIQGLETKLRQIADDMDSATEGGQIARVRTLSADYVTTQATLDAKIEEWGALYA